MKHFACVEIVLVSLWLIAPMTVLEASESAWMRKASGDWNDETSWSSGIPNASGDSAVFTPGFPSVPSTIRLGAGGVTLSALESSAPTYVSIVGSDPIRLVGDARIRVFGEADTLSLDLPVLVAEDQDLVLDVGQLGRLILVRPMLAGSGSITKSGAGDARLPGFSDNWIGVLDIQDGVLDVTAFASLGRGGLSGETRIRDGATLRLRGGTYRNENFLLDGGQILAGVDGDVVLAGDIRLDGSGSIVAEGQNRVIRLLGKISGDGDLFLGGVAPIELVGRQEHTGQTHVNTQLLIERPNVFGTTSGTDEDATIVHRGGEISFTIDAKIQEKFILDGGRIGVVDSQRTVEFEGPVEVTAPGIIGSRAVGGNLLFNGPLSGDGLLTLKNQRISMNSAGTYSGTLRIDSAVLVLGNSQAIAPEATIELLDGWLEIEAPGRVNLVQPLKNNVRILGSQLLSLTEPKLELTAASIDFSGSGGLADVTDIVQNGIGVSELSNVGASSDAKVSVERGWARVIGGSGLGSAATPTFVTRPHDATLAILSNVKDDIYLNNSHGFLFAGGLTGRLGTVTGDVYLGDEGSTVGASLRSNALTISGAVHGGQLTALALTLTNAENTYSGPTVVGVGFSWNGGFSGNLTLRDAGRLENTAQVIVNQDSSLVFDKEGSVNRSDSLADNIPITLYGGSVDFKRNLKEASSEAIGQMTLARGASSIRMLDDRSTGFPNQLIIESISRQPNTTLHFDNRSEQRLGGLDVSAPVILVRTPPVLSTGLIGGWATASDAIRSFNDSIDFATYVPDGGVTSLGYEGRPAQVDGALASDNVLLTGASVRPLTADVSINSLANFGRDSTFSLDLNGQRLTIRSGGLIKNPSRQRRPAIRNGRITAGQDGNAELFVAVTRNDEFFIDASIVDSDTAPLALMKTGRGLLELSGENRFSGPLVVNEGSVKLTTAESWPGGNDLRVLGGDLFFDFEQDQAVEVGTVELESGMLGRNCCQPEGPSIEAQSYLIRSGSIGQVMVGNGPLTKVSPGRLDLHHARPDYSGQITIEEGTVVAGSELDDGDDALVLGTGDITIQQEGILVNASAKVVNRIQLNGGTIAPQDTDRTFLGPVHVESDSTLYTFDGLFSPSEVSVQGPDPRELRFRAPVTLSDDVDLEVLGPGVASFRDLFVGKDTTMRADQGTIELLGIIQPLVADASLSVDGQGNVELRPSIVVPNETSLRISRQSSPATVFADERNRFVTGGGRLTANVEVSNRGRLQPGDGVGRLTVDGDLSLAEEGIYEFEIQHATAGPGIGWDIVQVRDKLQIASSYARPSTIRVSSLDPDEQEAALAGFQPSEVYRWTIAAADRINRFDALAVAVDSDSFRRLNAVSVLAQLELKGTPDQLYLLYRPSIWGDSNLDGRFDSSDLVSVFQAGRYEDGTDLNASWSSGDWDGDGDFTTGDLVAAFVAGAYERAQLATVPEPDGWLLAWPITLWVSRARRRSV